jgi:hypothetical protein
VRLGQHCCGQMTTARAQRADGVTCRYRHQHPSSHGHPALMSIGIFNYYRESVDIAIRLGIILHHS